MCAKFHDFLNGETHQRNFHFSLIYVVLNFNTIIMNILQKNWDYPIRITEMKLFYQCNLKTGLKPGETFG